MEWKFHHFDNSIQLLRVLTIIFYTTIRKEFLVPSRESGHKKRARRWNSANFDLRVARTPRRQRPLHERGRERERANGSVYKGNLSS